MKRLNLVIGWLLLISAGLVILPTLSHDAVRAAPPAKGPFSEIIQIPIRWCVLEGSPSLDDPTLVGEATVRDVLWRRHERASDHIYLGTAGINFRSGATIGLPTFPVIPDPDTTLGSIGDVVDPNLDGGAEFETIINDCQTAWDTGAPTVTGITAVHIRRFVDLSGTLTDIGGLAPAPRVSSGASQLLNGILMVIDNAYLLPKCSASVTEDCSNLVAAPLSDLGDPVDKVLGHELGHTLTLVHGDGLDSDGDGIIDGMEVDVELDAGLDTLEGPNLMQYQIDGLRLTPGQIDRMRQQAQLHIPDVEIVSSSGLVASSPLGNLGVDGLGDVLTDVLYADLNTYGAAVDPALEVTYLVAEFSDLIPSNLNEMGVIFLADTDTDPGTGGNPGQLLAQLGYPIAPNTVGVELLAVAQVISPGIRLFEFEPANQSFQEIIDPRLTVDIVTTYLHIDTFNPAKPHSLVPTASGIQVIIPNDLIAPLGLSNTIHVLTTDPNRQVIDEAKTNLTFEVASFPTCEPVPAIAGRGDQVEMTITSLPENKPIHLLLGATEVVTGSTNSNGRALLTFTIPLETQAGTRLITVGLEDPENAITADCVLTVLHNIYLPILLK